MAVSEILASIDGEIAQLHRARSIGGGQCASRKEEKAESVTRRAEAHCGGGEAPLGCAKESRRSRSKVTEIPGIGIVTRVPLKLTKVSFHRFCFDTPGGTADCERMARFTYGLSGRSIFVTSNAF
jgi:hypothetical protein